MRESLLEGGSLMPRGSRTTSYLAVTVIAGFAGGRTYAASSDTQPTNDTRNPYRTIEHWAKLPDGRTMGSTSAVDIDRDGKSVWVVERCGANSCAGKDSIAPVLKFDPAGNLLKSFGEGMFIFPHGICVDKAGNIWITDGQGKDGKGHQVFKFSPDGKVLMTLGKAGVAGDGEDTFNEPNDVAIAPNGDIFISDGHNIGRGNARVVKFTKDGKFIKSGAAMDLLPASLKFHTRSPSILGRLFVADRGNNRIQIFNQDGKFLAEWKQFARPSGVFIDKKDNLYVTDSESQPVKLEGRGAGYGYNPGFQRGIRIGSAKDGSVVAFIPDADTANKEGARPITSAAEGVAADAQGNGYGAEVGPKDVKK